MRVFVIPYKELFRWDPVSFFNISWNWPEETMKPIGSVLIKREEKIDLNFLSGNEIQFITIHFDGSIDPRIIENGKQYSMQLYRVYPNDVVLSKIDLKNGAVGVAPKFKNKLIAVTSHFAVYIAKDEIIPEYFRLVIQNPLFKEYLWRKKVGAEGRKEVKLNIFESIKIPVPPLSIQRRIVEYWTNSLIKIDEMNNLIKENEANIEENFLNVLGFKKIQIKSQKGAFIVGFTGLDRWDTFFFREEFIYVLEQLSMRNALPLKKCAKFVHRGYSQEDFPEGFFNYIQISNVNGNLGITGSSSVSIKDAPSRATQLVKENDIIISTTRPYLAAFARVPKEYANCVVSSGFSVIESTIDELDKDFLLLFLKSYPGLKQFEQRMTGGLYPAIVQSELEKILIPIPPIENQKEIIRIIENIRQQIEWIKQDEAKIKENLNEELNNIIIGRNLEVIKWLNCD